VKRKPNANPGAPLPIARRQLLTGAASALAVLALPSAARAQTGFEGWVARFKPRALARGVSEATYNRVMGNLKPDTSVYDLMNNQAEFNEALWQYLNRRVSDFRITTGKEKAKEFAAVLAKVEKEYGVDRYMVLSLWGNESSYGDVIDNPKYMRPVIPALAALAYGGPRRRPYWEAELLNALVIVERGWANPKDMIGSWAGAMGHTQWMPEVWLNMGVDYDKDGRIFPFGKPDDAFAGTARYLVERGNYRRGEAWGCEVKLPAGFKAKGSASHPYSKWHAMGVTRADGKPFEQPGHTVRLRLPVSGGPAFLTGQNFAAVMSYNPATAYALAVCHLADRIKGGPDFIKRFPGSEERIPTVAEVREIQTRLTKMGFDTDGTDGRAGRDTMKAVRQFQRKINMEPADGYPGLAVLARLRKGA